MTATSAPTPYNLTIAKVGSPEAPEQAFVVQRVTADGAYLLVQTDSSVERPFVFRVPATGNGWVRAHDHVVVEARVYDDERGVTWNVLTGDVDAATGLPICDAVRLEPRGHAAVQRCCALHGTDARATEDALREMRAAERARYAGTGR